MFNRWCHSKEVGQDFEKLKQMVLLEEFKENGNYLAGEKVMVDPRVVEKPRDDEKTEKLAEKSPGNTFNEGKEGSHEGTR